MKREFDGKVKLTGVGYADGIKAEKLIVGDILACSFGYSEKIVKIEDISKSYILVTLEYESICTHKTEVAEKKIKKDRIVPVSKLVEEVKKETIESIEITETFESVEAEIEIIEKELLKEVRLNKLIEGTGFNTIILECITPFDCGRYKVKQGHIKRIDSKKWEEYKDDDCFESCGAVHPKLFYKVVQNGIIKTQYGDELYNKLMDLYKKSNMLLGI
jgi:hypothetical protein